MCGFAGVVAFDRRYAVSREMLGRMSAAVAHRGPDGEGMWFSDESADAQVAFAHRRLAILDPDPRSNQPFSEGALHLVFNGEIYNFRELRAELSPREWKTTGDTEVLLAAYAKWGPACVDHLNGMFALAIWDEREKSLFLARDRMGQKPLYIAIRRGENEKPAAIAFGSEIPALLAVDWVDRSSSEESLREYLRWGYVPFNKTIYAGIGQVAPSQTLFITAAEQKERTYFNPFVGPPCGIDPARRTRDLVQQAVARQLVSDVPLGCFLSGGMDSSIIAAAMRHAGGPDQKILTFSIGFDDPRYDETPYAAAVAAHLKTDHRQFIVRPDPGDLTRIAGLFGQPMGDSSALPTYYLSRHTREHVKVALSGDGGDELFGGYERYRALRLIQSAGWLPFALARPFVAAIGRAHPKSALSKLRRLCDSASLPEDKRYALYMRLFDEPLLVAVSKSGVPETPDFIASLFMYFRGTKNAVPAAMAVDRATYLPDDLLAKVDRCSMAYALEVRSPFMDHDLVTFASGLTTEQLLGGGSKTPLRRAFAADLPEGVFKRKKMGFAVPIGDWLRMSLAPMLHDLVFAGDSFAAAHFRRETLENLIREHGENRRDHSQRLYALLMLELWWRNQPR